MSAWLRRHGMRVALVVLLVLSAGLAGLLYREHARARAARAEAAAADRAAVEAAGALTEEQASRRAIDAAYAELLDESTALRELATAAETALAERPTVTDVIEIESRVEVPVERIREVFRDARPPPPDCLEWLREQAPFSFRLPVRGARLESPHGVPYLVGSSAVYLRANDGPEVLLGEGAWELEASSWITTRDQPEDDAPRWGFGPAVGLIDETPALGIVVALPRRRWRALWLSWEADPVLLAGVSWDAGRTMWISAPVRASR